MNQAAELCAVADEAALLTAMLFDPARGVDLKALPMDARLALLDLRLALDAAGFLDQYRTAGGDLIV